MGGSSYYSSDEETSVRYRRDSAPRTDVRYVQTRERRAQPTSYYATGPSLMPDTQLVATTRIRSRSRERRSSPPRTVVMPPQQQMAPVVIHNNFNEHSSDDDSRHGARGVSSHHHRHYSHHRSPSHSRSPSRSRHGSNHMTREEYELEQRLERTRREVEALRVQRAGPSAEESYELRRARRELEDLRAEQDRDRERALESKSTRETSALRQAKKELDEIKRREELVAEEKRIKRDIELQRLEDERREEEEKERRNKEAKRAVEKYKMEEAEREKKEREEKELGEREYQRRLQEQLIASGVDEKDIKAIMEKKKLKDKDKEKERDRDRSRDRSRDRDRDRDRDRPTYTRMARRHLSIETLRVHHIDFDYDQDPDYILIKRWVPEDEQNSLWIHTRTIRREREARLLLTVDGGHKHSKKGDDFEWVRKKERKRSKSPGLLMYLAGAK